MLTVFTKLAVYSRNRVFRLFQSNKIHKASLLLKSETCSFPASSEKEFFTSSLVTNVNLNPKTIVKKDPNNLAEKHPKPPKSADKPAHQRRQISGEKLVPFPKIQERVLTHLAVTSNYPKGKISSWAFFPSSKIRKNRFIYNTIAFLLIFPFLVTLNLNSENRFCENLRRFHKSNHIYFIVDLIEKKFVIHFDFELF